MFTGLVAGRGRVTAVTKSGDRSGDGLDLTVDLGALPGCGVGASIALSGVCCTVVAVEGQRARFHLSAETLARTWFSRLRGGETLNLEAALRAGDPLGGHLVQGHVDATGAVAVPVGPSGGDLWATIPSPLLRYCVAKGSLTLDGVSLTIAELRGADARIAVIPHTAQVTTLGSKQQGDPLHVEVDVLAKYVESMLAARGL
jgi:riboflavin synthase